MAVAPHPLLLLPIHHQLLWLKWETASSSVWELLKSRKWIRFVAFTVLKTLLSHSAIHLSHPKAGQNFLFQFFACLCMYYMFFASFFFTFCGAKKHGKRRFNVLSSKSWSKYTTHPAHDSIFLLFNFNERTVFIFELSLSPSLPFYSSKIDTLS